MFYGKKIDELSEMILQVAELTVQHQNELRALILENNAQVLKNQHRLIKLENSDLIKKQKKRRKPSLNRTPGKHLTTAEKEEIIRLYEDGNGLAVGDIASMVGRSNTTVSRILHQHLGD